MNDQQRTDQISKKKEERRMSRYILHGGIAINISAICKAKPQLKESHKFTLRASEVGFGSVMVWGHYYWDGDMIHILVNRTNRYIILTTIE
jgi:hypothetical protein